MGLEALPRIVEGGLKGVCAGCDECAGVFVCTEVFHCGGVVGCLWEGVVRVNGRL